MAPHDDETSHDVWLRLQNIVNLNGPIRPARRDKQGFRKRPPKVKVAVTLTIGAILTALAGVIVRRTKRK